MIEKEPRSSSLNRVANKSTGLTVLGAVVLVAGIAVIGLCVGLGITLSKDDHDHKDNKAHFSANIDLCDSDGDLTVTPEEKSPCLSAQICGQHADLSEEKFKCLDEHGNKDGKLQADEVFDLATDVAKYPPNCENDEDTICSKHFDYLFSDNENVTYCQYSGVAEHKGMKCPVMSGTWGPVLQSWKPFVRGHRMDTIKTAYGEATGPGADKASAWSKRNVQCVSEYKERAAAARVDDEATSDGEGGLRARALNAASWSHKAYSWRDNRLLCNNIVKKAADTNFGATHYNQEIVQKADAEHSAPTIKSTGTGGAKCIFVAYKAGSKKQGTGDCMPNPCAGLGDGSCTPELTGGRCVYYDKDDEWNPYGQGGCYQSPCNNPNPGTAKSCKNAPFRLNVENGFGQKACTFKDAVKAGELVDPDWMTLKWKEDTFEVKNKPEIKEKQFGKVWATTKPRCNRFICVYANRDKMGCQNGHPFGYYVARQNQLLAKGKGYSRSRGCTVKWEGTHEDGKWVICPTKAAFQNGQCSGWRRELCTGSEERACACSNVFCSDPTLSKRTKFAKYGLTPPPYYPEYKDFSQLSQEDEEMTASEKTCTGVENIPRPKKAWFGVNGKSVASFLKSNFEKLDINN